MIHAFRVTKANGDTEDYRADTPIRAQVDDCGSLVVAYTHGDILAIFAKGEWRTVRRLQSEPEE